MTIQRGLSGQTDPVWGAVQKIPEGCAVPSGSCQLGGELDKRDQDGRLLSCRRGRCAPWPGGQKTAALTPGPPPLWQDTQGWPDPALPAAARKTGQSGSDPGGFTRELAAGTHTARAGGGGGPGREGGPGLPRRRSRLPGAVTPTLLSSPPREPWLAGRPAQEGRKGRRQRGWEPVPTLEAGPASRRAGSSPSHGRDLAKRAAPRVRTALHWACREAAVSKRGSVAAAAPLTTGRWLPSLGGQPQLDSTSPRLLRSCGSARISLNLSLPSVSEHLPGQGRGLGCIPRLCRWGAGWPASRKGQGHSRRAGPPAEAASNPGHHPGLLTPPLPPPPICSALTTGHPCVNPPCLPGGSPKRRCRHFLHKQHRRAAAGGRPPCCARKATGQGTQTVRAGALGQKEGPRGRGLGRGETRGLESSGLGLGLGGSCPGLLPLGPFL